MIEQAVFVGIVLQTNKCGKRNSVVMMECFTFKSTHTTTTYKTLWLLRPFAFMWWPYALKSYSTHIFAKDYAICRTMQDRVCTFCQLSRSEYGEVIQFFAIRSSLMKMWLVCACWCNRLTGLGGAGTVLFQIKSHKSGLTALGGENQMILDGNCMHPLTGLITLNRMQEIIHLHLMSNPQ